MAAGGRGAVRAPDGRTRKSAATVRSFPVCGGGCSVAAHTELGDMHQPSCHKGAFESAVVSLAQRTAAVSFVNRQSAIHQKRSKLMKITVIKKATTTRKPQNYCPWVVDDGAPHGDSK